MADARARTREWTLWVVAIASALHATEELLTGWQAWALPTLGIAMPTSLFVVMNTVLVIAALMFARLGWRNPTVALIVPAATLVNGVFFHIVPTIIQGRIAPGFYTATFLYLPFSSWALIGAARDGVPRPAIAKGCVIGTLVALSVVAGARMLRAP